MKHYVYSLVRQGIDAKVVSVEGDHYQGHPGTVIVGLGDRAVMESKERIRTAFKNSQIRYPRGRVVVNLAPANLFKEGVLFDLPIALTLCLLDKNITYDFSTSLFFGELGLGGQLKSAPEIFSLAYHASSLGFHKLYVPEANAEEISFLPDITVYPVRSLSDLLDHISGDTVLSPLPPKVRNVVHAPHLKDPFADIIGQHHAKRVLSIAAAGGHNVLFCGPPGSGKSLLCKALRDLLPPLSEEDARDVYRIHSSAMPGVSSGFSVRRPFRSIHHSASPVALVGGGSIPRPGEISMAHKGVLFLDELTEFPRSTLEVLRQPLEDRVVHISRSHGSYTFPADLLCCAAMNPCPCGYFGSPRSLKQCICSPSQVQRYQQRLSGPFLDRFPLLCSLRPLPPEHLFSKESEHSCHSVEAVSTARVKQQHRNPQGQLNARLSFSVLKSLDAFSSDVIQEIQRVVEQYSLSTRRLSHVVALARTIADLEDEDRIAVRHIFEAVQYSRLSFLH